MMIKPSCFTVLGKGKEEVVVTFEVVLSCSAQLLFEVLLQDIASPSWKLQLSSMKSWMEREDVSWRNPASPLCDAGKEAGKPSALGGIVGKSKKRGDTGLILAR